MLNYVHLSRIDLNLLVLFDVVLRERHVGRAASQLSLSASAVSHGLGRLRRLFADPLFLRTPKGVVPTERANELAPAIADLLGRVDAIVSAAVPFDAATSTRRFILGMADATAVVLLPALLENTRQSAPFIDIGVRQVLPLVALAELEARTVDVAISAVVEEIPARFTAKPAYEEEFVIGARKGHPFLRTPTLKRYCEAGHVLVSGSGDAHGFIDQLLEQRGLRRRVALSVPNFMLALASVEHTDLITALPGALALSHAARFGVACVPAPMLIRRSTLHTLATDAAMQDAGVAWLFESLVAATQSMPGVPHPSGKRARSARG